MVGPFLVEGGVGEGLYKLIIVRYYSQALEHTTLIGVVSFL